MWCRSGLEARVIGYNHHHQASEARRSAKQIRTNHRLRWPSVFWAEGATRCRWYLGLRDRQALECHAHLRVGVAQALVVPCSAAAGQHGQLGLAAARRRHPGAAGRRATADRRLAKRSHLPFGSFVILPILPAVLGLEPVLVPLPVNGHPRSSRANSSAVHRPLLP